MKGKYNKLVKEGLERISDQKNNLITNEDIQHLPEAVKRYLSYTGTIGQERIQCVRAETSGLIRSGEDSEWMKLKTEQNNFFDTYSRFYYIKAKKSGIPAVGLHSYHDEKASMVIKLAGIFTIVNAKGPEMDQGETVTLFNDMCFLAPGTLISKDITWETIENMTVKATFVNGKIKISAMLHFNEKGELINFISNDRYETKDGKIYNNYPWCTPASDYKDFGGIRLASKADVIYQKPEGDFCYGKFVMDIVRYNGR